MPSPYAQAAGALETVLLTEFAPEKFRVLHDNLHPAVGQDGVRIGIAPEEEAAASGNMIQNNISITVKFYLRWDPDVDYDKKVDPRPITEYAERFRKALRTATDPSTGSVWYYNLLRVRYPNDPVGNKTRFEADLVAYGNNSALVETVG